MKNPFRNASPPQAPVWFQSAAEQIEFESADETGIDDPTKSRVTHHAPTGNEPEFATCQDSDAVDQTPPLEQPDPPRQMPATPATTTSGVRIRDVALGCAAATVLFAAFFVGFLSRGLVTSQSDPNLQTLLAQMVSQRGSYQPGEIARSEVAPMAAPAVPAMDASTATVALASGPAPVQKPVIAAVADITGKQPEAKTNAATERPLDLTASLPSTVLAKPRSGSLKMSSGAGQPVSLNLASNSTASEQDGAGAGATQCSGPVEGTLGTKIAWADSPDESWQMASDSNKLVFMMHVSGNFEKPGFT